MQLEVGGCTKSFGTKKSEIQIHGGNMIHVNIDVAKKKLVFSKELVVGSYILYFRAFFVPIFARTLLPQNIVPDKIEYD